MLIGEARELDRWTLRLLIDPLRPVQLAVVASSLVLLFTVYCQIYCRVAFHPMHGANMPLRFSSAWAVGAVLPWLACFEICKTRRFFASTGNMRYLRFALVFTISAALSVLFEIALDRLVSAHTRPVQMQFAAQLPGAAFVSLLLLLGRSVETSLPLKEVNSEPLTALLRLASTIEWIEAAGNYVEVHAGGRATLHRVTMQELEQSLDPSSFARIHRSTIVAKGAIDARILVGGSPAVRLHDGTLLKIGGRFAKNLESLAV